MSANRYESDSGPAFFGNEWVSRIRTERDRADRAEETLRATQAEADHVVLRATETAEALLVFAQEVALEVVRTAQVQAESVMVLAQGTAKRLLKPADADGQGGPLGTVPAPPPEDARVAEDLLDDRRAVAAQGLRLRQTVAAEALSRARTKAAAILEVGRA